ncbi:MAG: hypothetical protein QM564_13255, partial [Bergeyella sp.]
DVSDLHAVLNENNELVIVSANVCDEKHYTGDIRRMADKNLWAVFSDSTIFNERMYGGVQQCVDEGIYSKHQIDKVDVQIDHYIWVKLNIKNLEFKF